MFTLTVPQSTTRQQIANIRAYVSSIDFRVRRDPDAQCAYASGPESIAKTRVVYAANDELAGRNRE